MYNRCLRSWYRGRLACPTRPERSDCRQWVADRWFARLAGRTAMRLDFLNRYFLARFADQVDAQEAEFSTAGESGLGTAIENLRRALAVEGLTPALEIRAFALIREQARRRLGKFPYRVQLIGGYALLKGNVAEMATGEGKTLTAALPLITAALAGVPVHLITVNDYLARRDAATLAPLYEAFGLSVGVLTHTESEPARRAAYAADVLYCVNKDLVFDYLRDGLDLNAAPEARARQRGLYFAIVDEADSVLIDEARTPLIIARETADTDEVRVLARALEVAVQLQGDLHYQRDASNPRIRLTAAGRQRLADLFAHDRGLWQVARLREERIELALSAYHRYRRGEHYVIRDDKIQIVDEFTGRILPDRSWERGLHQMVELKEGCAPSARRETIARQTYPRFFGRYLRLAGMTGTAAEVAAELRANYGVRVVRIPTHKQCRRIFKGIRIFGGAAARWDYVARRAVDIAAAGGAVLIGTRSVAASQTVAEGLDRLGAAHVVLNALQDEHEAEVVAAAGQPGHITVATNMAGRGTDIAVHPDVLKLGGLHVILTEFHESARIDRQLFGRSARQGDEGSCEACASLDDELFTSHAAFAVRILKRVNGDRPVLAPTLAKLLAWLAQSRAERRNAEVRRATLEADRQMQDALAFSGSKR